MLEVTRDRSQGENPARSQHILSGVTRDQSQGENPTRSQRALRRNPRHITPLSI